MTTSRLYASKKLMGALLLMMGFVLPANAQFLRTSYFMEGTHYRQQLNPAQEIGIRVEIVAIVNNVDNILITQ